MFTGLIQDVGRVYRVQRSSMAIQIQIQTRLVSELKSGDSLAVNGVCLTVSSLTGEMAVATAIPATLSRTNLGDLRTGARVNLEPALRVGDRLGGHIVQGHVDGIGQVVDLESRAPSLEITVAAAADQLRYIVEKGSITIDGVSLTVAAYSPQTFMVALIPHTLGATTLQERQVGDMVNIEVDVLAKYVERMLSGRFGEQATLTDNGPAIRRTANSSEETGGQLTEDFLRRHGFT